MEFYFKYLVQKIIRIQYNRLIMNMNMILTNYQLLHSLRGCTVMNHSLKARTLIDFSCNWYVCVLKLMKLSNRFSIHRQQLVEWKKSQTGNTCDALDLDFGDIIGGDTLRVRNWILNRVTKGIICFLVFTTWKELAIALFIVSIAIVGKAKVFFLSWSLWYVIL